MIRTDQENAFIPSEKLNNQGGQFLPTNRQFVVPQGGQHGGGRKRLQQGADAITLVIARAMKAAGLTFKSWLSRYELAIGKESGGIPLPELGFEAQMHQFYAKSRSDKAVLRKKYERFRELTPLLGYNAQ